MAEDLRQAALDYHRKPKPGKLGIHATKRMSTQRDLALAYSPGVAAACEEIAKDPARAWDYTVRANLVAVISNGSAVLGPRLHRRPRFEAGHGKARRSSSRSSLTSTSSTSRSTKATSTRWWETIARLEPTFGAINLEDIKAPRVLRGRAPASRSASTSRCSTTISTAPAICVAAAALNALRIVGKTPDAVRVVCSGAGAAAIACLDLLRELGVAQHNISVCDRKGVVHAGRTDLNEQKKRYALDTDARTLDDAIAGADIFLGLSGPGTMTQAMVRSMGAKPIILALSRTRRPRSCPRMRSPHGPMRLSQPGAPTIRTRSTTCSASRSSSGARSDCGATEINTAMKLACVRAIADLGDRRILRCRGRGLWRPVAEIRPRLHHPEAL